jgi:hypothetical protein
MNAWNAAVVVLTLFTSQPDVLFHLSERWPTARSVSPSKVSTRADKTGDACRMQDAGGDDGRRGGERTGVAAGDSLSVVVGDVVSCRVGSWEWQECAERKQQHQAGAAVAASHSSRSDDDATTRQSQ